MMTPDEELKKLLELARDPGITQWESRFIRSMKLISERKLRPTLRQREVIHSIVTKYHSSTK